MIRVIFRQVYTYFLEEKFQLCFKKIIFKNLKLKF